MIRDTERDPGEARRELYAVMRESLPVKDKIRRLLSVGRDYLGVDHGYLARTDIDEDRWETVVSTDPPDGKVAEGKERELGETYCREVVRTRSRIDISDAPNEGWENDPAYEKSGMRCYHGTPVLVDGEPYGTACFSSSEACDPFTETERVFVELVGELVGSVIRNHRYTSEITRRDELISVLNRVLRHNLRNGMNVISGYADMIEETREGDRDAEAAAMIREKTDEILSLSEKARRLEDQITEPPIPRPTDVLSLVEEAVDEARDKYPNASVSVSVIPPESSEAVALAAPRAKLVFKELLENAAEHAGESPTVKVDVEVEASESGVTVTVSDDGPGMSEQDLSVLSRGDEEPLRHGSGLGLSLVYYVSKILDAEVEAESSETGTVVSVRFAPVSTASTQGYIG
ncbi:ATP-binding protein [Halorutilales archaeon Cl-col2-1]